MKNILNLLFVWLLGVIWTAQGFAGARPQELHTYLMTSDTQNPYYAVSTSDSCKLLFEKLLDAAHIKELEAVPDEVGYQTSNRGCEVTSNGKTLITASVRLFAKTTKGNGILKSFTEKYEDAPFFEEIVHFEAPQAVLIRYDVQGWAGSFGMGEWETYPKIISYEPGLEFAAFNEAALKFRDAANVSSNLDSFTKYLNQEFPKEDAAAYISRIREETDRLSLMGQPIYVLRKKSINWGYYFRENYPCPAVGQCIR